MANLAHISTISLNTRGTIKNYNKIITEIKSFDIALLQEQHIDSKKTIIEKIQKDTNSTAFYTIDTQNNKSIITLVKTSIMDNIKEHKTIILGRVLGITIRMKSKSVKIWNIYAPAVEKDRLVWVF